MGRQIIVIAEQRRGAEPRRMFVGWVGIAGLLNGLFPQLAQSRLVLALVAGIVLMAILALVGDRLDGYSLRRSVLSLVALGLLTFAVTYLPVWFTAYYMPAHPELYQRLFPFPPTIRP